MKKIFILFLISCMGALSFSFGRTIKLSGYILDEKGTALPYANIMMKNSTLFAVANEQGYFQLTIPNAGSYQVRVLLTGYETHEQLVNLEKDTALQVTMKNGVLDLDAVTVTSTRTPKLLKEVPVLTRVITANDIRKVNAATVKELLEMELPGLEFVQQMDGQTVINMQGMGGNDLLFLIDGERMAGETLNNVDYNRLNVQNIERIEIVKGSASTLYGSSAIGGVINIITRDANEPWQVNVNARYGAHRDQRYGASMGFKKQAWSSLTTATYNQVNSYYLLDAPDSTGKQTGRNVYGGRNLNVSEKLTWQPIEKLKMVAKGGYYLRDRSIYFGNEEKVDKKPDRYQGFNGGMQLFYTITDKHQLQASYAYDQYNKYVNYVLLDSIALTYRNARQTARLQYDYFINKRQTLSIGSEFLHDQLMTYQFEGGEQQTNTGVIFAQHDWTPFKGFNLLYGARVDYHSTFGIHVSPKISLMYNIKSFTFRGSYGHGFRSPALKELYMDWDHQGMFRIMGNPNLVPEKSNNVSLSAEYSRKKVNVSVTGYYNNIRDKITEVFNTTEDTALYVNVNRSIIWGSDVNVAVKLPAGFGIRLSYSYVNDQQMEEGINVSDTRPHSATARFTYDLNRKRYDLNVTLNGRFLSDLDMVTVEYGTDDAGKERAIYTPVHYPAYTMWKLSVNQRFCNAYSLSLGIDNLFNYKPKVYTYNTTLSSGITFFAGIAIDIDKAVKKKSYKK